MQNLCRRGNKILLQYGKDWKESWSRNVKGWMELGDSFIMIDRLCLPIIANFNTVEIFPFTQIIEEQMEYFYLLYIIKLR